MNILDLLNSNSRATVLDDGKSSLNGATLHGRVADLATRLRELQIQRLALHANNGIDWIITDLACHAAGIVCVPLPLFFNEGQLLHAIRSCGVDALLTAEPACFLPHFATRTELAGSGLILLRQPAYLSCALPDGTGKVTFTSGSTGTPKGVCLGNAQQLLQAQALADAVALRHPRHLCLLPLSTLLENIAGVYAPLLAGGTVLVRGLRELGFEGSRLADPKLLLATIARLQPDTLILIPQLLQLLVLAASQGWQVPSLKFIAVGGARVPASLVRQARVLGLPVYEGYGLSECCSVVSLNTPAHDQPGTAGKVLPHLRVSGNDGELHVAGNAMLGYVGERDSWHPSAIATGDIGHVDPQGFLHLAGRRKNLIISSYGRNISPEWVESELLASPLIAEAIVLGEGRPHCVALLTPARAELGDAALASAVAAANAQLPDYAQVRQWLRLQRPLAGNPDFVTPNGKPRRSSIEQAWQAELDALYARAATTPVDLEVRS